MRILYILNDTLKRGGTESVVLGYASALKKYNIEIDFMLHTTEDEAGSNELVAALKSEGTAVYCVTPRRISVSDNKKDIIRVLSENRYDIVHAHADCANYLILKYARTAGVKVRVAHSHNTNIPIKRDSIKNILHYYYLEYCRKNVCRVATDYMACSDDAARWMFGNKADHATILKNAIEIEKYLFDIDVRNRIRKEMDLVGCIVLGDVARLDHVKNQSFLIDVFSRLYKHDDGYRLLLVGDGEDKQKLKKQAQNLGVSDGVIFYGASHKVNELLQAMDIFVFPSKWEGLGISLIEAQAAGLKCIVSDRNTIPRQCDVTGNVVRLDPDNQELWEKAIRENIERSTLNNNEIKKMISDAGYDIEAEAVKLKEYYEGLMR